MIKTTPRHDDPSAPTGPFPPLPLTREDTEALQTLARQLVAESIEQYERFVLQEKAALDRIKWMPYREHEDLRVFSNAFAKHLPHLLMVGTVVGTVDDSLYGALATNEQMTRLRTSYLNDKLEQSAVLACLEPPDAEDPCQGTFLKWACYGTAGTKKHDLVFVESLGSAPLCNSERVGFRLMHSVEFPQTPALAQCQRARISLCVLTRQKTPALCEVFAHAFVDPVAPAVRQQMTRMGADALVAVDKHIKCAQMKKLAWMLRRQGVNALKQPVVSSSSANKTCVSCRSAISKLSLQKERTCQVCLGPMCRACRVRKTMSGFSRDGTLLQLPMHVCVVCFTEACKTDALQVAQDEFAVGDAHAGFGTNARALSMSSSSSSTVEDSDAALSV